MKNLFCLFCITVCLPILTFSQTAKLAKVTNTSNQKLHFSYENKFGEIKSIWVDAYKTHDFFLENGNKQRITFEYNSNLFPCIVQAGDKLMVERLNNTYTINNCDSFEPYFQLSEKFSILKSPFFGINYTSKTDFKAILNEIEKYKTNRLNLVNNYPHLNKAAKQDLLKIIDFRYIDELLAPFLQVGYPKIIVPAFYKEKVDLEIEKLMNSVVNDDQFGILKQYFYGIFKYKLLTNENAKYAQVKLDFVGKYYKNSYLKNYMVWKLYQEDYLNRESKAVFENYFKTIALDKDYFNRIDSSWK